MLKFFIKQCIKVILYYSGMIELLHSLITSKLRVAVILRYHSVADLKDENFAYASPQITVSTKNFEEQIRYLAKRYNIISLEDIVLHIKEDKPLPKNSLAITFDDGYKDNYLNAYPILKKYGVTATFFLAAGCLNGKDVLWTHRIIYILKETKKKEISLKTQDGSNVLNLETLKDKLNAIDIINPIILRLDQSKREEFITDLANKLEVDINRQEYSHKYMLSWAEVKEMEKGGMSFGSHTITHCNLPHCSYDYAKKEIEGSKTILEEELGKPINLFSYPNGTIKIHFNEEVKRIVEESGFISAVTSVDGVVDKKSDLYELKRKGVGKDMKLCLLATEIVISMIKEIFFKR
ncbi:MAG: polysaccharide deacetylase family protein [bacterium]